jgi:hypothetical protein
MSCDDYYPLTSSAPDGESRKYKHHMRFDIKQHENRFKEIGRSKDFWFVTKTKAL